MKIWLCSVFYDIKNRFYCFFRLKIKRMFHSITSMILNFTTGSLATRRQIAEHVVKAKFFQKPRALKKSLAPPPGRAAAFCWLIV